MIRIDRSCMGSQFNLQRELSYDRIIDTIHINIQDSLNHNG